jgi:signal peptidase I
MPAGPIGSISRFWRGLDERKERILAKLPQWLSPWVRDIVDVGLTVAVVIVVLKLLFGADMLVPLVVVTSESMVHQSGDNSWSTWLLSHGYQKDAVDGLPLSWGFNMGDMILVKDPHAALGDVIIYERDLDHLQFSTRDPIIHRVVGVAHVANYSFSGSEGTLDCFDAQKLRDNIDMVRACQTKTGHCPYTRYPSSGDFRFFITKGDNNEGTDQCNKRLNISYPVTDAQVTGRALLRLPYLGWPKLLLNLLFRIVTLQF